ncbi:MAG: AtpZ/AtpI family protein [Patescibacteria group bacterium]
MTKTTAPGKTPSPAETAKPHTAGGTKTVNHTSVFIGAALDMSWRLAIVVLVPIIGGFELDKRLEMTPLLTVTGFVVAMLGMALVMWRTLQQVNTVPAAKQEKRA